MLRQVRIRGLQRSFEAPSGESILQSGLRAGLNLPYSCERGGCGECRARLLAGSVSPLFHFDHRFPARDQAAGWFLTCAHEAASDVEIEIADFADLDQLPLQTVPVRVRRLTRPDPERLILQLRCPRSSVLRFIAGQQVELGVADLGSHRYFLANCPCDAINPVLHLRRRAGEAYDDYLFDALKSGDFLLLRGPFGRFVLPRQPLPPLLFVCWETGFAAVQSLLEQALASGTGQPVQVLWCSQEQGGRYLRNYCRSLADAEDVFAYEGVDLPAAEALAPWLLRRSRHVDWSEFEVFAVVPIGVRERVGASLRAAGVAVTRLHLATADCF